MKSAGKIALITRAADGIGAGIANAFGQAEASVTPLRVTAASVILL